MEPHQPVAIPADGYTADTIDALIAGGVRYGTILADPPWQYECQGVRGAAGRHYETLDLDAIAALPVGRLAAADSHLHLWATAAFLFDARRVMELWGFTYKGVFVWVKPHHQLGTGYYWRNAAEFLLLGVRGGLTFRDHSIPNWGCFDRHDHSQKPERVRALIERVSPGPYLELFGRRAVHGWTVFGDEVSRGLFDERVVALTGDGPPAARPATTVGEGYVSVRRLAERLGVSKSVVYAHVSAGHLPHVRVGLGRGTIRIPAAEARAFEERLRRDDAAAWSEHFA